jgi:hypothetical protein
VKISTEKAIEAMRTIYGIQIRMPQTLEIRTMMFAIEPVQHILLKAFGINGIETPPQT